LKFLSVKSIVIAPAKTGKVNTNKKAVITKAHIYKGILYIVIPLTLIFIIVVIKLILPAIEDTPAKCNENMAKSTLPPECATIELKGGYIVQPVPAPVSTINDKTNNKNAGGNNQKLKLLSLGKAISGLPINSGKNQLPKPPINEGITKKNTIIKPWAVTTVLYNW
jgi:hypothetical protein